MREPFLIQFESLKLPKEEFNHEAHIYMAFLYLSQNSFPEALIKIRDGIRSFAHHYQVGDLYHESISFWFSCLINHRIIQQEEPSWDQFKEKNKDLFQRGFLDSFYSKDFISQAKAKRGFLLPDLLKISE